MSSVARDSRRVFGLGLAGLVPAAVVTLLLVHQPSIGVRRLYPVLRGSLALAGLGLAAATLLAWATAPNRLSRLSLTGLAWAGVTVLVCIGPLLESSPRTRLYALDLRDGTVMGATSRTAVDDVSGSEAAALVGLDPAAERTRCHLLDGDTGPGSSDVDRGIAIVDGHIEGDGGDGGPWSLPLSGERALAVAGAGDTAYAYVSTPGVTGDDASAGGAVISFDVDDGELRWRVALPEWLVVTGDAASIAVGRDAVVVAGGERIAALEAGNGRLRWTQSVVTLGKSRGYALPGAVQQVVVSECLVFLSATPDA